MRADEDRTNVDKNGVLPPEHLRLRIAIGCVETTPASEADGRRLLEEIRRTRPIRLRGWRPMRDELHERR